MSSRAQRLVATAAATVLASGIVGSALAQVAPLPVVSLDQVPIPEPRNLGVFVKDRAAAVRLGKALFWDVQVGSDGLTACATCHFHAGTDNRTRNTLGPGANGGFDGGRRANADVRRSDFPFHRFQSRDDRFSPVTSDTDDVVGAQGVPTVRLDAVVEGSAVERGRLERGGLFAHNARNARQVTGRNAPSVINAIFNFANFWDGRANHFFNGANPFGIMDVEATVLVNEGGSLDPVSLTSGLGVTDPTGLGTGSNPYALDMASLASQAVGPPPNDVEMSFEGRSWRDIGRKLLTLKPLGRQRIHALDSVLQPVDPSGKGLVTSYGALIEAAFHERFWNGPATTDGYSHMEANFALFFGLAVQLYEATLVSDDTPFDRHLRRGAGDPAVLTQRQLEGMNLFFSLGTECSLCHVGPELTAASIRATLDPAEPALIEVMSMGDGDLAAYDIGFYNIGVRPIAEDLGRGARHTFPVGGSMPLSLTGQHFERLTLPFTPIAQPGCVNNFLANPPSICPPPNDPVTRQAVAGAFKTPGLRNVELTGPYMHNGGMATLMQVVDFYVRGGDFHELNLATLDPFVAGVEPMKGPAGEPLKEALVDFLLALTDERVRWERAPFDHPQLFVPDGHAGIAGDPRRTRVLADRMREVPAVGRLGRQVEGLPPLKPFLAAELEGSELANFHFQH
jgi:cytochrome c peroxidase